MGELKSAFWHYIFEAVKMNFVEFCGNEVQT